MLQFVVLQFQWRGSCANGFVFFPYIEIHRYSTGIFSTDGDVKEHLVGDLWTFGQCQCTNERCEHLEHFEFVLVVK